VSRTTLHHPPRYVATIMISHANGLAGVVGLLCGIALYTVRKRKMATFHAVASGTREVTASACIASQRTVETVTFELDLAQADKAVIIEDEASSSLRI
jgi:hypothetical protein